MTCIIDMNEFEISHHHTSLLSPTYIVLRFFHTSFHQTKRCLHIRIKILLIILFFLIIYYSDFAAFHQVKTSGPITLERCGAEEAHGAHNPGVTGSKPVIATRVIYKFLLQFFFLFFSSHFFEILMMTDDQLVRWCG